MKSTYIIAFVSVCLSACAVQPVTVSRPETIVYGGSNTKIRNAIARACDEVQLHIEQQSENSVTCGREAGMGAQIAYQYGNGSAVQMKYQFNWFEAGDGGTKVTGNAWYEAQNAFGASERNNGGSTALAQSAQAMLNKVKARVEGGRK